MATDADNFATPPRHGRHYSGRHKLFILLAAAAAAALVFFALQWWLSHRDTTPTKRTEYHSTRGIPFSEPQQKPVQAAVHMPRPPASPAQRTKQMIRGPQATPDPVLTAAITGKNEDSGTTSHVAKANNPGQMASNEDGDEGEDNALSSALRRTKLGPKSRARVDRNYLYEISAGRKLLCNRSTATNSQLPGFITCDLPEDVYNDSNTVKLLPKGTHVRGEYKQAVLQGNDRLFVLWTEIRTNDTPPIKIPINSPAADQLGAAGMTGVVNNHFWSTFFATAVYTLLEAGPQVATAALQSNSRGNNEFQYNQLATPTQSMGSRMLQERMNRPPTLESNPGEPLLIFVGSDIDCSGAVQLRLIGAR